MICRRLSEERRDMRSYLMLELVIHLAEHSRIHNIHHLQQ